MAVLLSSKGSQEDLESYLSELQHIFFLSNSLAIPPLFSLEAAFILAMSRHHIAELTGSKFCQILCV